MTCKYARGVDGINSEEAFPRIFRPLRGMPEAQLAGTPRDGIHTFAGGRLQLPFSWVGAAGLPQGWWTQGSRVVRWQQVFVGMRGRTSSPAAIGHAVRWRHG